MTATSGATRPAAPRPATLAHLRPTNAAGAAMFTACAALTGAALWLSSRDSLALWLVGQVALALALVQWFAVLHECGHETLFRTKRLHAILGPIAGFFSIIPF